MTMRRAKAMNSRSIGRLRQAFTCGFMGENPGCFDPRKPAKPNMQETYDVVASHMDNLGSTNKA